MSSFAIRYPFFILMACLGVIVIGTFNLLTMPVDLFPEIKIPVVLVMTFYNGMPPEQVEADITNTFERFFTLGSGIDHIESRSMSNVSLIKVYFQPGTNPAIDASEIANLAMADLRRLPKGALPPVVLSFDASNLPVCLVTVEGKGLSTVQLKDYTDFDVRDQLATVKGASVPRPFGGANRKIMVYVDPMKLQAHGLSINDVYKAVNKSNLILPAGDVRIGPMDYNIYANSEEPNVSDIDSIPLKTVGDSSVLLGDVGHAEDTGALQYNIVRVNGQHSVYLPIFKQGGSSNTITIVDGVRKRLKHLLNVPPQFKTNVVFDQSVFVRMAVKNVIREGAMGLLLTALMIFLFLGSLRATVAVLLTIPLSVLAAFILLHGVGGDVNTMVLGGLALALSRLIDNSVIVLENIFRHMEMGEPAAVAAEQGGKEVDLAVLAATIATSIVFFPVVLLSGVSKYLFTALALGVVLAMFASYIVAMTVIPVFCAKFIAVKGRSGGESGDAFHADEPSKIEESEINRREKHQILSVFEKVVVGFDHFYRRIEGGYDRSVAYCLRRPVFVTVVVSLFVVLSLALYPFLSVAFFPRTDPGQFVVNFKAPPGTRLELTDRYCARVESIIRQVVRPSDLKIIVSNVGVHNLSAAYSPNTSVNTGFIDVGLKKDHSIGSYTYMRRVQRRLRREIPELQAFFHTGGLVDSVVNQGRPAPIDIRVGAHNMKAGYAVAREIAMKARRLSLVSNVFIPESIDYPGLRLDVHRKQAALLGLTEKDVVDGVITALTSNGVIAPTYWLDPKSGNNYMMAVQYYKSQIQSLGDLNQIPLRADDPVQSSTPGAASGAGGASSSRSNIVPLGSVASVHYINTPSVIDHYQLHRVFHVYIMPKTEDLGKVGAQIQRIVNGIHPPHGTIIHIGGSIVSMHQSFHGFALGLTLAVVLIYLILMAQFASFSDPFVILLAVPPGIAGVLLTLLITGTSLNIMSLMGVLMMTGMAVSNSILIVEFANRQWTEGKPLEVALGEACRFRLRPIAMTTLATVLGIIPMSLGLEAGSQQYAPLARALLGGVLISAIISIFLVPAVYYLLHRGEDRRRGNAGPKPEAQS